MDKMKKALMVIEGSLLADEPEDKRLAFIYRMAHVGNGECEHREWEKELDTVYDQLIADNILSPIETKPDERRLLTKEGLEAGISDYYWSEEMPMDTGISRENWAVAIAQLAKDDTHIEALIEQLKDNAELIISFCNKEKARANVDKDALIITMRDMIHDMVVGIITEAKPLKATTNKEKE